MYIGYIGSNNIIVHINNKNAVKINITVNIKLAVNVSITEKYIDTLCVEV